jgi:hypothetical protein
MDERPLDTPHPPLTAAERAELEAENRMLIEKLKRLLSRQHRPPDFDDNGNFGVFHDDFIVGWDGRVLKPPPFCGPPRPS